MNNDLSKLAQRIETQAEPFAQYLSDDSDTSDGWEVERAYKAEVASAVHAIASKYGWATSCEYDSASTYIDVTPPINDDGDAVDGRESFQVRVSNHAMRYSGPVWSFLPTDSFDAVMDGLRAIAEEIEG